jgi:hypothetical protein
MLKVLAIAAVIAGLAGPAFAMQTGSGPVIANPVAAGCTMDPFAHQYVCPITTCRTNSKGQKVCTTIVVRQPY